ncbi:DUF1176 domain-containing protein [Sphingomonas sp. LB-2]|uniref:DUF1176 domain-containing protein n=1 Tax=Sphingomonas caeni TaxID=2984949 RepID=UPI0022324E57|nr:DUF1176 domain-containing protein [Sphingomonas caeni]MCW3846359.1 DUF1176 domain-containing protein [Sphingomonas caeni]
MMFWRMLALAASLMLTAAAPAPGQEKLFGNWAVVCDNVKRCEATALMPESWSGDEAPGLDIARDAGPAGAVTVAISPIREVPGIIDILIDRHMVGSGTMRDGSIHLTGGTAEGIARAFATARQLTLRSHGKIIATISLTGSSAALRYIDAEQGRAGGVTALVARGPKSAVLVPAAAALPKVPAMRPGRGKAATLPAAQLTALRTQAGCDGPMPEGWEPEFDRLDGRSTLLLLPCGMGAYQGWAAIYVLTDGKAVAAQFDFGIESDRDPVPTLTEAEWDAGNGSLNSHAKGRGLGDCGISREWVWDGSRFRMTLFNGLDACRLSGNWMTRYRAQPVYK